MIVDNRKSNGRAGVDPNKKDVFISLGTPVYNELVKGHLRATVENALAVGFDDIVFLDDGSTDGTWEVLKAYAEQYDHIRIYRNEKNSVLNQGKNRWKDVVDKMAEKNPDWIVIRAADQIYSHKATIEGGDLFRKKLTKFYHDGIEAVNLPLAHMWRSKTWYRSDNVWGRDIKIHQKIPIWRFHPDYSYRGRQATGTHLGWHHPTDFGFPTPLKRVNINTGRSVNDWDIVVIHLGHDTHNSKVLKFKWSMDAAKANSTNGRSTTMPPPDKMPPVRQWLRFDGYKGFYEFNMILQQAPKKWFPPGTDFTELQPIPESMYDTIREYNQERAEEYRKFHAECYSSRLARREILEGMGMDNIKFARVSKGNDVQVFPNCVIGRPPMAPKGVTEIDYADIVPDPVTIGAGSIIGANTVIYSGVKIGKNCLIGDGVHIRENVEIGDNCIIGIGCKVGARTKINDHTRVMDLTNVASDAYLGSHVFIGPGVMMGNDNAMGRDSSKGGFDFTGPYIDDWVTVGMNANLLPSTKIGKDSIVAAGSTVTREVPEGVLVMGAPAKIKRELKENEIRCQK